MTLAAQDAAQRTHLSALLHLSLKGSLRRARLHITGPFHIGI